MLKDLCFEIIQTCPNKCKFCSSNSSKEKETIITLEKFKETVEYFITHGGIGEISISGGEPFLHPDFFEIVKFCKNNGLRTVVFTSGIKKSVELNKNMVEYFKNNCKNDIQEIEESEPWNERLKKNVQTYYDNILNLNEFSSISREDFYSLKSLELDKMSEWEEKIKLHV